MDRPPTAVATFGRITELDAKMGHGIIRYCDSVRTVIDPLHAGAKLSQLVPYTGRDLPIVSTLEDASAYHIEEVVIGASPPGGSLTPPMLDFVANALSLGYWVVHGMHETLRESDRMLGLTDRLVELRHVAIDERVAHGDTGSRLGPVILTVGSDCAAGKMTTALELWSGLRHRGHAATLVATGQTGMYISGAGAPLDAIRADFVAGVVEQMVADAPDGFVLVEGQGSLHHPAYSGVSLALLHGAAPDLIIFCHDLTRRHLAFFGQELTDLGEQIDIVERIAAIRHPASVVAVAAMAGGLAPEEAAEARRRLSAALGLAVLSPTEQRGELTDLIAEFS